MTRVLGMRIARIARQNIAVRKSLQDSLVNVDGAFIKLTPRFADSVPTDPLLDEELRARVALYLQSSRTELADLGVTAANGTVTLWGEVPSFYLRQLALERTRRVAGVYRIIDQIEVNSLPNGVGRSSK